MTLLKNEIKFRVFAVIFAIVFIGGIVLAISGMVQGFKSELLVPGLAMTGIGFFLTGVCLLFGFRSALARMALKKTHQIMLENKEEIQKTIQSRVDIVEDINDKKVD